MLPTHCLSRPFLDACTMFADSESDRQRRAEWRPGMYVRVHGHISSFGKSQEVIAFNIRPVVDHNEVRVGRQGGSRVYVLTESC